MPDSRVPCGQRGSLLAEMKILHKPFALIAATAIAKPLSRSVFQAIWSKIDDQDPPSATTRRSTLPKVLAAAALEAATAAAVGVAVERGTALGFHYVTGIWPGEELPEDE